MTSMLGLSLEDIHQRSKPIAMKDLPNELESARNSGKYCMIFDKSGTCSTFFTYKGTLREFHKSVVAITANSGTKAEALEDLRRGLVESMRNGDTFVIDVGELSPDFKSEWQDSETWPMDAISRQSDWLKPENHMKIVREEENVDYLDNPGGYVLDTDFTLAFLAQYSSDQKMVDVMNNIPNSDLMHVIIIDPTLDVKEEKKQQYVEDEMDLNVQSIDPFEREHEKARIQ